MFFSSSSNTSELNNVFQHKDQGIPKKDLLAVASYARIHDVILLFRPVETLTKNFHEDGNYPTKSFKVKVKSASRGLCAGFIPVNPEFSKSNAATIEEAKKEVQACIQQGYAMAIQLIITEKRFQELLKKEIIFPQNQKEGEYLVIYCPHPYADEHPVKFDLFYAKKINAESGIEYEIYTSEKKPFYVLADLVLKRPLIADYDLLAVFSPWKNYSQDYIRLNPHITPENRQRRLSPKAIRRSLENPEDFLDREDPTMGNVANITKQHIAGLNKILNKGEGLQCIHHSDDAGSPFSNPEANYPATVVIPPIKGFASTIFMIENTEQLVDFLNKLNLIGDYRIEVNPLWEPPVKWAAVRNYFFSKIQLAYCKDKSLENLNKTLIEIFKSIGLSDTTLTKELTNLFGIMTRGNFDNKVLLEKFFDIIQSSLFLNSTLVVKLCRSLETILNYEALSEKNIDRLLTLNKILRKDVQDFYEILDILNILPTKDARIISDYLESAETHIYNNKLDRDGFKHGLEKFSLESKINQTATFRP
ncbi:anthrax toxin-like adenylyl cyclase domain-containing protein [Rickettsiella endosymbiont of Miltochrista miniata]|uniref:anthrax toxin-like adenylyl cyclase domain-containing protein n=1 Tax=Rickettsiella endosymbiont of Miltochrista miniata TaxID=3066239 RepID=UPI00313C9365